MSKRGVRRYSGGFRRCAPRLAELTQDTFFPSPPRHRPGCDPSHGPIRVPGDIVDNLTQREGERMNRAICFILLFATPIIVVARQPDLPHFDPQTTRVAFVENGDAPLSYTTGVVDARSFWKQYGSSVGTNVGGIVGTTISSQSSAAAIRHPNGADSPVQQILGENKLAATVNGAVIERLAAAWGFTYKSDHLVVLKDAPAVIDPNTKLISGLSNDADLVLMAEVHNVNLTERFSMGGALAAGLTFGANKKSLTTEVSVVVRAIQHNAADGSYKQIWAEVCGPNYTTMKTAYPLKDLVDSHDKVMEIVKEATEQSIAICSRRLAAFQAP